MEMKSQLVCCRAVITVWLLIVLFHDGRSWWFVPISYLYHIKGFSTTVALKYSVINMSLLQLMLYCFFSFIYRFRSRTKLNDEPAYYLMQVVCHWCMLLSILLLWWLCIMKIVDWMESWNSVSFLFKLCYCLFIIWCFAGNCCCLHWDDFIQRLVNIWRRLWMVCLHARPHFNMMYMQFHYYVVIFWELLFLEGKVH